MTLTVAIVGRPNVGKSTLFNRLVKRQVAIVEDRPGVTRDRRMDEGRLGSLRFRVIDTAGFDDSGLDILSTRMMDQTMTAIDEADLVLLLVDGRSGLNPIDSKFSQVLHQSGSLTLLVVTKCEGNVGENTVAESWGLGFGSPIPISAEHAEGLGDLHDSLYPYLSKDSPEENLDKGNESKEINIKNKNKDENQRPLRLAIVGRPNVGKSTLLNRLVGEERVITGPEVGLTRDSISVDWEYGEKPIQLIDTAGLRRRSKIQDKLEKHAARDAIRSIDISEVVALMFDGSIEPLKQDFSIASLTVKEGRAPIIILNKWDCVEDQTIRLKSYKDSLATTLSQAKGVPIITLSALTGEGIQSFMPAVLNAYEVWNRRIATSRLNSWLRRTLYQHPPPLVDGRRTKLRYVTQIKSRPPTFSIFCNITRGLSESYQRYLANSLREEFDLPGVPIRLILRKGENPYIKSDSK
mgnify:CR=1 FL=1